MDYKHLAGITFDESGNGSLQAMQEWQLLLWEEAWISPLLELLATADDRMLSHLSIYAMPVPLAKNPGSILQLLQRLLQPSTRELIAAQVAYSLAPSL